MITLCITVAAAILQPGSEGAVFLSLIAFQHFNGDL